MKLIQCVFSAQGPPLNSFTYVSKYSCPSTRLKYSSSLTQALRHSRLQSFFPPQLILFPKKAHAAVFTQEKVTHLNRKELSTYPAKQFPCNKTCTSLIIIQRSVRDNNALIKKVKVTSDCVCVIPCRKKNMTYCSRFYYSANRGSV